jgi:hypothetical protein
MFLFPAHAWEDVYGPNERGWVRDDASPSASASPSSAPASNGPSTGLIAGLGVALAAVVFLIAGGAAWCCWRRSRDAAKEQSLAEEAERARSHEASLISNDSDAYRPADYRSETAGANAKLFATSVLGGINEDEGL